jgi:hypothetical protein
MIMKEKRGRNSGASLETVLSVTGKPARPAAPARLTPAEAEVWKSVVAAMPAVWFPRESHGLLAQYCCHVIQARYVSQMIGSLMAEEQKDGWLMDYDRLLKMQERESRAMTALARGMRMTQQSRIDPKTAGRRISGMPRANLPWMPPNSDE